MGARQEVRCQTGSGSVNTLKAKGDARPHSAKNVKRPKRGEANHVPSFPVGETADDLEKERQELLKEEEIVEKMPLVEVIQDRWPAAFIEEEIDAEFLRITTLPLQARFLSSLDRQSSQLLQVMRSKGGAAREKITDILKPLDQSVDVNIRREHLLKALVVYQGEDFGCLFKEYKVDQKEKAETELGKEEMAIFIFREGDSLSPPKDIGIIVDGMEVLDELSSVASACAILFGLIYTLNLNYPVELKYTFETFQRVIMDIESKTMTRKVQNLSVRLSEQ